MVWSSAFQEACVVRWPGLIHDDNGVNSDNVHMLHFSLVERELVIYNVECLFMRLI